MPAGLQDYTYLNNYPIKMREILGLAGKRSINIINIKLHYICIAYTVYRWFSYDIWSNKVLHKTKNVFDFIYFFCKI